MIIYDNITNSIFNYYHRNYIKHLLIFVNRVKNVDFVSFCEKFRLIWRHIKFTSKILLTNKCYNLSVIISY